jgi:sec-independent protein translocase protein TatA
MKGNDIMGGLLRPEMLIIVVILILIFGAKRLPEMGSNVAKGIKEFKKGINDDDTPKDENGKTVKSIDSSRIEVDAIERELERKKAELAAQERAQAGKTSAD